jgi:DNA-binding YbaB/EbfC family protein
MGLFGQVGDMYKLQKEAKKIKKELSQIHIFAERDGIKVTVSGEQKVLSVEITNDEILANKNKLEKAIVEAINAATEKAQKIAAEKMKVIMGGMPGLGN